METFSALRAICAGNSPAYGEFPSQRPGTRSFDVFFDLHLNKRLSKQSRGWWFETLSPPLWRRCNDKLVRSLGDVFRNRSRQISQYLGHIIGTLSWYSRYVWYEMYTAWRFDLPGLYLIILTVQIMISDSHNNRSNIMWNYMEVECVAWLLIKLWDGNEIFCLYGQYSYQIFVMPLFSLRKSLSSKMYLISKYFIAIHKLFKKFWNRINYTIG